MKIAYPILSHDSDYTDIMISIKDADIDTESLAKELYPISLTFLNKDSGIYDIPDIGQIKTKFYPVDQWDSEWDMYAENMWVKATLLESFVNRFRSNNNIGFVTVTNKEAYNVNGN
jgi:hypothetical protein